MKSLWVSDLLHPPCHHRYPDEQVCNRLPDNEQAVGIEMPLPGKAHAPCLITNASVFGLFDIELAGPASPGYRGKKRPDSIDLGPGVMGGGHLAGARSCVA